MNKDFDFGKVEKKLPYNAPASFFENAFENTLKLAKEKQYNKDEKSISSKIVKLSISIAAAIILLAGLFMFYMNSNSDNHINNNYNYMASNINDTMSIMPNEHQFVDSVDINDVIKNLSDEDLEDIVVNVEIDILYADLY